MSDNEDADSFNDGGNDGNMSDDSFNDAPIDDDDQFDSPPTVNRTTGPAAAASSSSAAAASSTSSHAAASSSSSSAPAAASSSSSSTSSSSARASQLRSEIGRQGDYVIQDEGELRVSMDALTKDVASVLHVPAHLASMLLRTHNWNKEKFVTQYFEDPDRLLLKHGLQHMAEDGKDGGVKTTSSQEESDLKRFAALPSSTGLDRSKTAPSSVASDTEMSVSHSSSSISSSSHSLISSSSSSSSSKTINCPVCYDDYPIDGTVALGCGHRFCFNCWGVYLTTAVNDGKLCILSKCAAFKCPLMVPDKTFKNLTPPETYTRHQQYLVRSYVEDNRMMRWCPAQRCAFAVRVRDASTSTVKCRCGFAFCFQCGEENHAPVNCEKLSEWLQKCKNESETAHWIIANTKKCPRCAIRIEKNQGCNHMTCRGCKFEWCWVCHGDWQSHGNHTGGYYKCNKWDPKEAKPAVAGSPEEAKAELNRYLHYYQRYHNHDQSKRFAEKQKIQTEKRMATLHAQSGGDAAWIDFQFLASATQQIIECRNVLKYTYVFAYYLEDGPEKTLFEFLQQQLESSNEHLSELSELPPLEKIDRTQIVNYTRITQTFVQNLLQGVQNGLTPQH